MNPRPTICFLTGTLDALAGAERVTAVIANGLARRGWQVRILCLWSQNTQYTLDSSIRLDALHSKRPSFKSRYIETVLGIRRYVADHQIDILISVDTMLTLFTLPACFRLPVRQIAWEHCNFDQDLGRRSRRLARRLAARFFERVVVLTARDRARWHACLNPANPVEVISNPLPFKPPESSPMPHSRTVLAVGRLTEAKGFDVLLRAWKQVAMAYPGWKLRIVGEGECRAELERLRDQLELSDSVTLPGATSQITNEYSDADIFCLSSRFEGFGMVLIEAMAFGLPVVSTDCETGPREILQDGKNALLAPVNDSEALAGRIMQLVADDALRQQIARGGAATVRRYMPDLVLESWERLLLAPNA
ncbi:GalNAc-alpha-(1-_4)-GalNAc-alpha-(1-_3)-diNAcBac-PP-undecaprenol alpha-1,4-N-acetyl-D-galactosaminyltransferase [Cupriavidus yeoncheonensis]|uniref:GalNAc-alpha-(1->4)-GalNAc-alpha-(1->3)-diNAcBac-PP-undecaprenol alpha-1,4-N-acetyl-D-galactosaminyltransferase n=1 Tax=Cupriavidus yeoncheonensis TaxID=1462994 RepID=A0A916IR83_9BURK|nr:glycosyltransferase family 4 protein [Cupriavidus yeoncheonensis]CAG2128484.1 GalNAc-alpha-(1->4)-GalNAc-alpha-(1->3)-diNAcBac-PP-undecaprenol alpha-1,4-N-acetyl-D-galactosaminyltransferase [Cupriavidus yeoncheonensis]